MAKEVNFGNITTTNGQTKSTGISTGLDSTAIIDAVLSPITSRISNTEDIIESNDAIISASGELKVLLDRFQTASEFLSAPAGVGNQNNDFFKHTTASVISSTTTVASNYLSVTTEAGATLNDYDITSIVTANAQQIRKDGFTSQTTSVVGNASIIDNYQASLGTVSLNVLNSSTPITFSNDIQGNKATIDIVFTGDYSEFEALDEVKFSTGTTLTFGALGGDSLDITGTSTVAGVVAIMATYMNTKTSGEEARYEYSASGTTLTATRNVAGSNTEVGTSMAIDADFSKNADTTMLVKIGSGTALNNPVAGNVNALGTDGHAGTTAQAATINVIFGSQNLFDATDELTFGATTITFGGTGSADIDISTDTTLDLKLDRIVTYMNTVASGTESAYTYSRDSSGVITATRDSLGTIATVGSDLTVSANFSKGTTDKTQTVAIGQGYKNNGSVAGSVNRKNTLVSGSVSQNGVDGVNAATKATISIDFTNNLFDSADSLIFGSGGGSSSLTFGGGGGTSITVGGDLPATLVNIASYMNSLTTGDAVGYTFTTDGVDSLVVTRDVLGNNASVSTDINITANFSGGADTTTNLVKIGSQAANINPAGGALNSLGTEGVNTTAISDGKTTHISTLSGDITINSVEYFAGTSSATSYTPNRLEFKATVGGVTYTSRPVELDGGAINAAATGTGDNFLGNRLPSGTVITFVKDGDSDLTSGTKDVTFQLTVGDEATMNNSGAADSYATSINTWLNSTNDITTTQSPTVPPLRAGTFSLGGVDITLNEGDNLQVIKSKINAVSATSRVSADIIKVNDNSYSLLLKSIDTGADEKIIEYGDSGAGDPLSGTIQLGADNVTFTQVQAGSDASFIIDGLTLTRSSNVISDAIDKITFSLISDTPVSTPPTLSVSITADNSIIKSGVGDFITTYNELKIFIAEQSQRDEDNQLVEGAILGDESILSDVLVGVNKQLSRLVAGISSGDANSLFAIGIDTIDSPGAGDSPEVRNLFVLDESKFDAALAADFEAFRKVFVFDFSANSPELSVFSRTNAVTLNNFQLDIDTTRADGNKVRVLDSGGTFLFNATLNGSSITGQAGTALQGLVMVYTGDGSDNIVVTLTQGIADKIYNYLDNYLEDGGLMDSFVDSFQENSARQQDKIDRDTLRLIAERALEEAKYSRLEAFISGINDTLSFIESQTSFDSKS